MMHTQRPLVTSHVLGPDQYVLGCWPYGDVTIWHELSRIVLGREYMHVLELKYMHMLKLENNTTTNLKSGPQYLYYNITRAPLNGYQGGRSKADPFWSLSPQKFPLYLRRHVFPKPYMDCFESGSTSECAC